MTTQLVSRILLKIRLMMILYPKRQILRDNQRESSPDQGSFLLLACNPSTSDEPDQRNNPKLPYPTSRQDYSTRPSILKTSMPKANRLVEQAPFIKSASEFGTTSWHNAKRSAMGLWHSHIMIPKRYQCRISIQISSHPRPAEILHWGLPF